MNISLLTYTVDPNKDLIEIVVTVSSWFGLFKHNETYKVDFAAGSERYCNWMFYVMPEGRRLLEHDEKHLQLMLCLTEALHHAFVAKCAAIEADRENDKPVDCPRPMPFIKS